MKRAAGVVLVAFGLVGLPMRAAAQGDTPSAATESRAGVPYMRVDNGGDDPYQPLLFEEAGQVMAPLQAAIFEASDADEAQLAFASAADLGGFQDAPVGSDDWSTVGVALVGVAAPAVQEGGVLTTTTVSAAGSTPTTVGGVSLAIPELAGGGAGASAGRSSFSFTDSSGTPTAPPDERPPLTNPPSAPTEGIDAAPPATTTVATIPPSSPRTTALTAPPATAPPVTTTTSSPPTTLPPTTLPPTTTSTLPPVAAAPTPTTTTTAPPTTTTTAPTTTTTNPPTTTTTVRPPAETFTLTQERPSATACVAPTSGAQSCDAIWSVPLAATGETVTFDLSLRNSGNVDASALHVWAGSACVTTSTATPSGTGDLCGVIQLTVQRYTTAARDVPLECVYGGGTAQLCSLSTERTLAHFSTTYPTGSQVRSIGTGLQDDEAAHLRLTLRLPEVDNRYQRRAATMSLTWRQVQ